MSDSYVIALNSVITKMTLYIPFVTIVLGTIGGFCNILTFTAKQLRQNACAFYFLCSAIYDLLTIFFCSIMRLMVDHYSYLLPNQSAAFCKLRVYFTGVFPATSTCCVMLASIDRCLLTSSAVRWRNWSAIKIAYRLVIIAIIFWLISPAHMLIFYDFYVSNGVPNVCSSQPGIYSTFVSIFFIVWLTAMPYTVMFIAGMITFRHMKVSRNRVMPVQNNRTAKRIDRHLILMMFLQVVVSIIFLSMRTVVLAYQYITRDVVKDSRQRAIELFISQTGIILYYVNYAKSFYLYTLTSPFFREIFWKRITRFWPNAYLNQGRGKSIEVVLNKTNSFFPPPIVCFRYGNTSRFEYCKYK